MVMSQLTLLSNFVQDLLDMRQLQSGVFSLTKQVFDPNKIVELVVDVFKPQAKAQKIDITYDEDLTMVLPD